MATFPVFNDIGLNDNEIRQVRLQSLDADPSPIEAKIYYNTVSKVVKYYNGTEWQVVPEPEVYGQSEDPGLPEIPSLWVDTDELDGPITGGPPGPPGLPGAAGATGPTGSNTRYSLVYNNNINLVDNGSDHAIYMSVAKSVILPETSENLWTVKNYGNAYNVDVSSPVPGSYIDFRKNSRYYVHRYEAATFVQDDSGHWWAVSDYMKDPPTKIGHIERNIRHRTELIGGGTITVTNGYVKWSTRLITIGSAKSPEIYSGYADVTTPGNGTVITGALGHANVTATGSGVPLTGWDALYFVPYPGAHMPSTSLRIVDGRFGGDGSAGDAIPPDWICLFRRNDDTSTIWCGNGVVIDAVSGTGPSYSTTLTQETIDSSIRAARHRLEYMGGGTLSVTNACAKWSQDFIVTGMGKSREIPSGMLRISMPAVGQVITGHNGHPNVTVTDDGIPMQHGNWSTLYYIPPVDGVFDPTAFRVTKYDGSSVTPANWIRIVGVNADDDQFWWMKKASCLREGESFTPGPPVTAGKRPRDYFRMGSTGTIPFTGNDSVTMGGGGGNINITLPNTTTQEIYTVKRTSASYFKLHAPPGQVFDKGGGSITFTSNLSAMSFIYGGNDNWCVVNPL